jgi:hypothetical protein
MLLMHIKFLFLKDLLSDVLWYNRCTRINTIRYLMSFFFRFEVFLTSLTEHLTETWVKASGVARGKNFVTKVRTLRLHVCFSRPTNDVTALKFVTGCFQI